MQIITVPISFNCWGLHLIICIMPVLGSLTLLLSTWVHFLNKVSCFVSTCVSSDNSFPSVRQEPSFGPWKVFPFLQQFCQQSPEYNLCKLRLFHYCQRSNYGCDLVLLQYEETHEGHARPEKDDLFPVNTHGIPFGAESARVSGTLSDSWTWQQWACGGTRPQPSPLLSTCPPSSSHHCLFQPPLGDTVRPRRPWCKPGPMSACLWEVVWCSCFTEGTYKQCWMGLMACLPRRITPSKSDPSILVRS